MLTVTIFDWTIGIVWFVLICVGALILILATFGLLLWLCCCCCSRRNKQSPEPILPKDGPAPGQAPAIAVPPPGGGTPIAMLPPPPPGTSPGQHVAVPVGDQSTPLTLGASSSGVRLAPGSPGMPNSPVGVKKWEEQLQATLFRKMSLEEIRASTGYFNKRNYVGEGAFAVVYRGTGPNGAPWAVKRSKQQLAEGSAGEQDFEKEVIAISRLAHKHLVRLLGYCVEGGEHILVYEYCPNGSLSSALYFAKPELNFLQRLDVAIGTAEALYYLHSASSPPIIHRDVKPDNVFLDSQLQSKLGDFGLLKKLLEVSQEGDSHADEEARRQHISSVYTRIAGTPGYLDPEYHLTSKVTAKGDVYSFGVLLLQLCTGQRAILPQHPKFNDDSQLKTKSQRSLTHGSEPSSLASSARGQAAEGAAATPPSADSNPDQRPALSPLQAASQSPSSGSRPGSATASGSAPAGIGTITAFAAIGGAAGVAGEMKGGHHEGEVYPGEPIHISTWIAPYVKARVVEPIADSRFGNEYNKTALFRMLEIGLSCVQPVARKRPVMSAVARWLHEVKEELERQVDEREGQYSSVFTFDRNALEGAWRGDDDASVSVAESQQRLPSMQKSAVSSQRSVEQPPSGEESTETSFAQDGSSIRETARLTEGR